MKNIRDLEPIEAVLFKSGEDSLVLTKGDRVKIITDGSEFDEEIECEIDSVTVDEICYEDVEHFVNIPWEYINEITKV